MFLNLEINLKIKDISLKFRLEVNGIMSSWKLL